MLKWAKDLFPICRSLAGPGNRQTLKYFFEWNSQVIKGFSAKIVCEKQFLMYMRGNQKK